MLAGITFVPIRAARAELSELSFHRALPTLIGEHLEEDQVYSFGVIEIATPLETVPAFTEAERALTDSINGLLVIFDQPCEQDGEGPDPSTIHDLSVVQRYFIEGVERQLLVGVVFVAYYSVAQKRYAWIEVPANVEDRWLMESSTPDTH